MAPVLGGAPCHCGTAYVHQLDGFPPFRVHFLRHVKGIEINGHEIEDRFSLLHPGCAVFTCGENGCMELGMKGLHPAAEN